LRFGRGRPVALEEHDEHYDKHHGDGHQSHGEYPYEPRHQLVVLKRRRLQRCPRRFGRSGSVLRRRRFPRARHHLRRPRRLVGLVPLGFPRGRLQSYSSAQYSETCQAVAHRRRHGRIVDFARGAVAGTGSSRCLPTAATDASATAAAAAATENRRSSGGRLAASGPVVAVRTRLVTKVRTSKAPAPDFTC